MTAVISEKIAPFALSIQQQRVPGDVLYPIRMQAWELLQNRGLPTKEEEAFHYFPLRLLNETSFVPVQESVYEQEAIEAHILTECKASCIVFIDGNFQPSLSRLEGVDERVTLSLLQDAMRTYGHFLRTRFAKTIGNEIDPFTLLNLALHEKAAFLYLPPKAIVRPLQVLFLTTQKHTGALPRLHIFAGTHANAELVVTNVDAEGVLSFPAFEIALEEGAHVRIMQDAQAKEHTWNLFSIRATLKKAARFSHLQWNRGAGVVRSDTRVWLQGEEANTDLKGVWMLNGKAQSHAVVRVDHEAPHTHSMQLFKGVLADLSQSSFEGKIYVCPEAQKTQAYQLNKNLLLSPHVMAHAKPNLEIFADDVKASHGATVAHLDDELLFYLKSRGITSAQAKSLLIEGFCREVLDDFSLPSLAKEAMHAIRSYLS